MKNTLKAKGAPFVIPSNMAFCQPIIPLAFDNSLSYYEFLAKVNGKLNETICVLNKQNQFIFEFEEIVTETVNALSTEFSNLVIRVDNIGERANRAMDTANAASETAAAASETASAASETANEAKELAEDLQDAIEEIEQNEVGRKSPAGETVVIDNVTYTYGNNAEYFNSYESPDKNEAIGAASHASGKRCIAFGNHSFAHGNSSEISGEGAAGFGDYNKTAGNRAFVAGYYNEVETGHDNAAVFGSHNHAKRPAAFIAGMYSDTDSNTVFAIGNGTRENNRKNAIKVDNDGYLYNPANAAGYRISAPMTQAEYDLIPNPDSRTIYIIIPGA